MISRCRPCATWAESDRSAFPARRPRTVFPIGGWSGAGGGPGDRDRGDRGRRDRGRRDRGRRDRGRWKGQRRGPAGRFFGGEGDHDRTVVFVLEVASLPRPDFLPGGVDQPFVVPQPHGPRRGGGQQFPEGLIVFVALEIGGLGFGCDRIGAEQEPGGISVDDLGPRLNGRLVLDDPLRHFIPGDVETDMIEGMVAAHVVEEFDMGAGGGQNRPSPVWA